MSDKVWKLLDVTRELLRIGNDGEHRQYDTVYIYDDYNDMYYTVDNIRIDSENDVVIDIGAIVVEEVKK